MTEKEVFRCNILQQVHDKHISQVKAAEILKISDRQIRNLLNILQSEGPKGLISKKRGKTPIEKFLKNMAENSVNNLMIEFFKDLQRSKFFTKELKQSKLFTCYFC